MTTIWNPNGTSPLPTTGAPKVDRQVMSEGQTLVTLTKFTYTVGTGSITVCINGVDQVTGVGFTETSSTSFTLAEPSEAGDVVVASGY